MLTVTYIAMAVAGCGYLLVALLLGQIFDGDGTGDGGDAFHFPIFSPTTIATYAGAIGAIGLIGTQGVGLPDAISAAIALVGGFVFTYGLTYAAWRLLQSSTGTQVVTPADLVGKPAEVITPIPEGGVGEVVVLVRGQRHAGTARSADGSAIPRGASVSVTRVAGATLIVQADGAAPFGV